MSDPVRADAAGTATDDLAGFLVLLWTFVRMNFLLMIRYRLNFAFRIVGMYTFFAIIFFGGLEAVKNAGVGGIGAIGSTIDAIIVGWFLFSMAQNTYSNLSGVITAESRWGTLEQLYISPYGFGRIMAAKVVVNLILSLLIGAIMLALMLVTTGRALSLDVLTLLPLILLTLLSVLGVGFVFGGLALIYKKLSSATNLMQLVIIGLVAAPAADIFALRFLPLVQGSAMLQTAMRSGTRLWEFAPMDLALLVGTATAYAVVGYVFFQACSQIARTRGVMGHY